MPVSPREEIAPRVQHALVALLHREEPVGVGYFAAAELICTCAHVVERCAGPDPLNKEIPVQLPFLGPRSLVARVIRYHPDRDVAFLQTVGGRTDDAAPLLLDGPPIPGSLCKVFGYPQSRSGGWWAEVKVVDLLPEGLIQVEDDRTAGTPVQQGFSGSPACDVVTGRVVGIVTNSARGAREACLIPADTLRQLQPEVHHPAPGLPLRILWADDDHPDRFLLEKALLKEEGCELIIAPSIGEAARQLAGEPFHAILIDQIIVGDDTPPDLLMWGGCRLLRWLRGAGWDIAGPTGAWAELDALHPLPKNRDIPAIIVSNYHVPEVLAATHGASPQDQDIPHLIKPVDIDRLLQFVKEVRVRAGAEVNAA